MTRSELQVALNQQQAENAALRTALARLEFSLTPELLTLDSDHERLVQFMQQLYPAVLLTDAAGRVTWVSDGFEPLCKLMPGDVQGRLPGTFLRPHLNHAATLAYIERGLAEQVPFEYEVPNPGAGTSPGWIRVRVQPLRNREGRVVRLLGLLEDITASKTAQLKLAANEARFRALAESVPGVLFEWRENFDGTRGFTYVSPKLTELFGIEAADGPRVLEYCHPADVPALLASIEAAVRTQSAWACEGRFVVPGQPLRWWRGDSLVTGHDAAGIVFSGILQDVTLLKAAEAALRERDLRLHLAVEGFGDGTWEADVPARTLMLSNDYQSVLGYREGEVEEGADAWQSYVHPDDLGETLRALQAHLSGQTPLFTTEVRLRCQDGTYRWVLARAHVTKRDATGEPLAMTGLMADISAVKTTQEALAASSRRLSTVIANFQEGVVLEDEHRRIVLTNEAFCNLLPEHVTATPAELVGYESGFLNERSTAYVRDPVAFLARIEALVHHRLPATGDVLALHDGRVLQRDFVPVFDHDRYLGHLWKYADITQRTNAEEDLRRREEKYRNIIENMSLGLVEVDLDGRLLYVNQSFCAITGFGPDELLGQELAPLLMADDAQRLLESKVAMRRQGLSDTYEVTITTKAGEVKWLLLSAAPLYNDARQLVGSIGIHLDVTPQKRLEASLREAKAQAEVSSRAKQDFLANMSHEIRTPMNAILGMSQLMAQTTLSGPQAQYLEVVTASAENLLVIINDILDLSKIEAGRMTVEQIGFSPRQLCAQLEQTMRLKAEAKGLRYATEVAADVPDILLGDPYRLSQVLTNLAGNAIKFTEVGAVAVSCRLLASAPAAHGAPATATVEFSVSDTGVGIEPEYLAQVFEKFSQQDSAVTRRFGGTGLGLGISQKMVVLLGGELRIASRLGEGTTGRFSLRQPVGKAADLPRKDLGADLGALRDALQGKRVLLVEDNVFNRMLATIFLTNAGIVVTEADNGQTAMELARKHSFDLLLMDVRMPVMDGYEAIAYLRGPLGQATPVVAFTANAIGGEREKCLAAGMDDYLSKPFQEAELLRMVHRWTVEKSGVLPDEG